MAERSRMQHARLGGDNREGRNARGYDRRSMAVPRRLKRMAAPWVLEDWRLRCTGHPSFTRATRYRMDDPKGWLEPLLRELDELKAAWKSAAVISIFAVAATAWVCSFAYSERFAALAERAETAKIAREDCERRLASESDANSGPPVQAIIDQLSARLQEQQVLLVELKEKAGS